MTTLDTAVKMLDAVIGGEEDVRAVALALVQVAQSRGVVLTVETVPERPLAMGHYDLQVNVRPARQLQVSKTAEEMQAAAKILEDNDARVGRRQLRSHGWVGR